MDRPIDVVACELRAPDRRALTVRNGLLIFLTSACAMMIGSFAIAALTSVVARASGASASAAWQYGASLGMLCGTAYGLVWAVKGLERRAHGALTDRGPRGCAWYGATDTVIAQSFLFGGLLNVAALVTMPAGAFEHTAQLSGLVPLGRWQPVPTAVMAFTLIAARPVLEELLFRGVLFGTFSGACGWTLAGAIVTVAFVLAHQAQLALRPASLVWIGAMAIVAMLLRIRHASLAPAIALHVGFNFPAVLFASIA